MRTIITASVAVVLGLLIGGGAWVYPTVRDTALQGTGFVAKNVCSGHFISGFSAATMMEEALIPASPLMGRTRTHVDEELRQVDATLYGLFDRRAVFRPGIGCVLLAPGEKTPRFEVNPIAYFAPPTNQPWPLGEGAPVRDMPGVDYAALDAAIAAAFEEPYAPEFYRNTKAVLVIYRGQLIAEAYSEGVTASTPLHSWSMAKGITQAQIGILVREGLLDLYAPPPVPEWAEDGDPRGEITLDQLLRQSSGLVFDETYGIGSHVTRMLSLEPDAGAYAAAMPLEYAPGEHWSYSSGTTNLLSRLIRQVVGGTTQDHYLFLQENLFMPLNARSAVFEPDASGTFIGSSYMYATARDWARFGQLYLQDGVWQGRRILPEGWVDYSRTPTPNNPYRNYGAHYWLNLAPEDGLPPHPFGGPLPEVPADAYRMSGYQGQHVYILPSNDLVVVRLGFTPNEHLADMGPLIGGIMAAVGE